LLNLSFAAPIAACVFALLLKRQHIAILSTSTADALAIVELVNLKAYIWVSEAVILEIMRASDVPEEFEPPADGWVGGGRPPPAACVLQ
jgi:hypothetical protein